MRTNRHDYDDVLKEMGKSYMDNEELEKIIIQSDIHEYNDLILELFGKHHIRARGVLCLDDIRILPIEQQIPAMSCFFQKVFDSYIEERIRRGFVPLKTLNSKKGAFE